MTNNLSSVLALTLASFALAACGAVEGMPDTDPDDDDVPTDADVPPPDEDEMPEPEPEPVSPVIFQAPQAATTPNALSAISLATREALKGLIDGSIARDITEQRFVTTSDEPITLQIALNGSPVVSATRSIATDMGTKSGSINDSPKPQCTSNNDTILLDEPRCNRDDVTPKIVTQTLPATSAWKVWILDETTGTMVTGCSGESTFSCTLPVGAARAYRVVTSIDRVRELWDGTALSVLTSQGRGYLGRLITANYCDFYMIYGGGNSYCTSRAEWYRPHGLDAVSLAFGEISVAISANGFPYNTPVTELAWSGGDNDFPGNTY